MRRRRWIGWSAALAATAIVLGLVNPGAVKSAGYSITEAMLRARAWTVNALWTFGAGIQTHTIQDSSSAGPNILLSGAAQTAAWTGSTFTFQTVSADFTMSDPTVAPTIGAEAAFGSCTNAGGQTFEFAYAWLNPSGITGRSTATAPYTFSGANKKINLTRPTPPTVAVSYQLLYAKGTESYGTWRECSNGSFTAVGTATALCQCSGTNVWGTNNTGAISPVSFLDGEIRSSKAAVTASDPRITVGGYRFKMAPPTPSWSPDSGVTFYSIALDSPQVRHVCPTTCQYATVTAALASISSTSATNRYAILVEPGNYNENATLIDYVSVIGRERNTTRIASFIIPTNFHEITISNMTVTSGSCVIAASIGTPNAYHGRLMLAGNNLGDPVNPVGGLPIDSILCCGDTTQGIEIFDFGNLHQTTYDTVSVFPGNTVYSVGSTYLIAPYTEAPPETSWLLYYPGSTFIGVGDVIVMQDQGLSSMDSKTIQGPRFQGGTTLGSAGHSLILKDSVFLVTATSTTRTAATSFWGEASTSVPTLSPSLVDISGTSVSITSASASGILAVDYISDGSDVDRGNWKFRQYSGSVKLTGGASQSYANVGTGSPAGLTFELGPPLDNVYSSTISGSAAVTYAKGFLRDADLVAGGCVPGEIASDNGGATRELCWCWNNAGSPQWACISATTTNGPTN